MMTDIHLRCILALRHLLVPLLPAEDIWPPVRRKLLPDLHPLPPPYIHHHSLRLPQKAAMASLFSITDSLADRSPTS